MATLAEIRAKLQASSQKGTGGSTGGDNAIYPFWNIQDDQTTTVRFLPDADPNNEWGFWIERSVIKMPFAGIVGETDSKPVTVAVPCMEMYGKNEVCPILTEARAWYKQAKDERDPAFKAELEALGSRYWKKRSYLFQGFVVDNKVPDDKAPENPIRRFVMNAQIFNIVKTGVMDPEIEELPTDYVRGLDFKIAKTKKGKFADYTSSSYARRERALDANEMAAIEKYGLFDLKSFLPKKPTEVELKVIQEMFQASVDGEAFDMARWGQYFKPSNYASSSRGNDDLGEDDVITSASPARAAAPKIEEKPVLKVEEKVAVKADEKSAPVSDGAARAQEIMQRIRSRAVQQ